MVGHNFKNILRRHSARALDLKIPTQGSDITCAHTCQIAKGRRLLATGLEFRGEHQLLAPELKRTIMLGTRHFEVTGTQCQPDKKKQERRSKGFIDKTKIVMQADHGRLVEATSRSVSGSHRLLICFMLFASFQQPLHTSESSFLCSVSKSKSLHS